MALEFLNNLYMLNDKQKDFLLTKGYLTDRTLDADTSDHTWKEYYIHEFNWFLHNPEMTRLIRLDLLNKTGGCSIKELYINLTDEDRLPFFRMRS